MMHGEPASPSPSPVPPGSADSDDFDDFQVTVEQHGATPLFALPKDWTSEDREVAGLTVTVVAPTPGTAAFSAAHGVPLVTFHDVGLSASTCYAPFFTYCQASGTCPEVYASAAHYHITAPGCMPDAATLPAEPPAATLTELGAAVNAAMAELGVRRAVGLGTCAGANVMFEAARAAPRVWAGLVLESPFFYASGYLERARSVTDGLFLRGLGLGGRVKERFLQRWLAPATLEDNSELAGTLDASLDRLNVENVGRYMQAEAWREAIVPYLRNGIRAKVLLVSGRESYSRAGCEECFSQFDPEHTSWLDVPDVGGLVHAEAPDQVAQSLKLFLCGFGRYEPPQVGGQL